MMKKTIVLLMVIMVFAVMALASCAAAPPKETPAEEAPPSIGAPIEDYYDDAPVAEEPDSSIYEETPTAPEAPLDGAAAPEAESYIPIDENLESPTDSDSLVTFSLKVDTASYSNTSRYLDSGSLPPADAVKVEELLNYFSYESPVEYDGHPLGVYTEIAQSPFDSEKYMAFIRVKAQEIDKSDLPPSNLVFLIDTSGSMDSYDKLPLLKEAFALLTDTLTENDRVSIVTYAGSSAVVLDGAPGSDKARILDAVYNLEAGGSTAGAEGIWTAYQLAKNNFIEGGNNRVILATDGDFNVGISSTGELSEFISTGRGTGIYLSTLGFGTGNLRDDVMETLAKDGNGNYSYIDSKKTAEKVLVDELGSNLFTIADDVKAQVEFNPANVTGYRLIGYENRQLKDEEFSDDTKDAGEIGVGTDVVILFELELANPGTGGTDLKYGGNTGSAPSQTDFGKYGDELFEVRLRYKNPGESESNLILSPVTFGSINQTASTDMNFACSVAEWGMQLRQSPNAAGASITEIFDLAKNNLGDDEGGYRTQHLLTLRHWMAIA
ncbi:VWA domain-containing protein [Christensenellaceae bacterium OttesenSCG-928-K19]|nr:VWA domain-containing protein [Christensenellaceae bacterium OttesenSCG-928-K19]